MTARAEWCVILRCYVSEACLRLFLNIHKVMLHNKLQKKNEFRCKGKTGFYTYALKFLKFSTLNVVSQETRYTRMSRKTWRKLCFENNLSSP